MNINNLDIEKIIENINKVKPFSGVVLVQQNVVIGNKEYGGYVITKEIENKLLIQS